MRTLFIVATGLLVAAAAILGSSQPSGSVSGVITDTTGRGLPGATITVTPKDGRQLSTVTDSGGRYRVEGLTPGRYTTEVVMTGFDPKETEITVSAGREVVWSGALLIGPVLGGTSIERKVARFTGSEALDCGRYRAPASEALRKALTCGLTSARARRPFSVIVQFAAGDIQAGHGLLARSDGVIHVFAYERGGMTFHLEPCSSPVVAPSPKVLGAGFKFACHTVVPLDFN